MGRDHRRPAQGPRGRPLTAAPRRERVLSVLRGLSPLLGGICVLVGMCVIAVLALRPPPPQPANAPAGEFSAERALVVLRRLLANGAPHPAGSVENRAFRSRLEQELRSLSLEPRVVAGWRCGKFGSCAHVENVIAELPAKQRGRALGIAAHYDSVAAGPGAADDGAGVASALELARALLRAGALERPVWLIFTDGEEAGLLGADLLAEEGSLRGQLELVLNLEARGVAGPSLMFQTSPGNLALVRTYAANTEHAVTSSLFGAVYAKLRNDSDLTVFLREGAQGLNFAFIEGARHYHTPTDDLTHLSPRSVQHLGDQALAMAKAFQRGEPKGKSQEDAIFFDLLGRVVVYPQRAAPLLLAASATALALLLAWSRWHHGVQLRRTVNALGVWLLAFGAVLLWGVSLEFVFFWTIAHDQPWPAHAWLLLIAVHAGTFAATLVVFAARGGALDERDAFFAELLGALLLTALLTLKLPEAQFVGLVPLVARLVLAALALTFSRQVSFAGASLCAIIPVTAVVAPISALTYHALGFGSATFSVCAAALLTLPLFPLLPRVRAASLRAASRGFAVLAVLSFAIWYALPAYSRVAPARVNLAHSMNADDGTATWLVGAYGVPPAIGALAEFHQVRPPAGVRLGGWATYATSAPRIDSVPPEVSVIPEPPDARGRRATLRITAQPGTSRLWLAMPITTAPTFVSVAGQQIHPIGASELEAFVIANPPSTVDLLVAGLPQDLQSGSIGQERAGLPSIGASLARARDLAGTPSQNGDVSVVGRDIRF